MKRKLTIQTEKPNDPTEIVATLIPKLTNSDMWELWINDKHLFDIIREEDGTLYVYIDMGFCAITAPMDVVCATLKKMHNTRPQ
jgi:hypothetical protein